MTKFIEYIYPAEPFSRKPERDIRLVDEFNINIIDIPAYAVSFRFIEADNLVKAAKVKSDDTREYAVVNDDDEIFTTQQIRDHGAAHQINLDEFDATFNKKENPEYKTVDDIDDLLHHVARPDSAGQMMMNFMANGMEQAGCHRVMGNPPAYCVGINDNATIINRNTRAVISLPYKMK